MKKHRTFAKGYTKLQCVKRMQELEARGFECITPMKAVPVYHKEYEYKGNKKGNQHKYVGESGGIEYWALMERRIDDGPKES